MKVNKTYSLDLEVVGALDKISNASKMINDLVTEALLSPKSNKEEVLKNNLEKNKKEILDLQQENKELKERLLNLEKHKKEIENKFKGLPKNILDDFRNFELTEQSLYNRWQNNYVGVIDWNRLKYYWELYRENEKEAGAN